MGQEALVEHFIDDGRKLVEQLRLCGFDVAAAAWIKDSEAGKWYLYVASSEVDSKGSTESYRLLHAEHRKIQDSWLGLFDVKLIGTKSPIAQELLEIQRQYSAARIPTQYSGPQLGDLPIDQAYIYPAA